MNYADQKHIPYVAIVGGDEVERKTVTLKDMNSGQQQTLNEEELIRLLCAD